MTIISFPSEALPRPRGGAVVPAALGQWAPMGASMPTPLVVRRLRGTVTPVSRPWSVQAPVATKLVRNSINYSTRVNAGGDGASGPYPEREPEPA